MIDTALNLLAPALVAMGWVAYRRRVRSLQGRGRATPGWRQLCFGSGLGLLLVAEAPPLGRWSQELVTFHMVQHLAIGDLAALLVVLGLTGPLLRPILAACGLRWVRTLGNPLFAFPAWLANLYLWHLATLYQGVLDHPALHLVQHAAFLGFGVAMWMPLVGPLPTPSWFGASAKLIYVVSVRFAGAVLANVLAWSASPLYPAYASAGRGWGISPLSDQGIAGMVMMGETGVVTLALLAWLLLGWAREETESQAIIDRARARGVKLDPARAQRAVRAGTADRLEQRIARRRPPGPAGSPPEQRR